jgi:hypothetical protein
MFLWVSSLAYTSLLETWFCCSCRLNMRFGNRVELSLNKRALRHISLKMVQGQLDVPCISLQLLSSVGKLDFPTERLRVQWQRRHASSSIASFYNMSICLNYYNFTTWLCCFFLPYLLLLFCQANVLEELLLFSASRENDMSEALQIILSKLKNTEARAIVLFRSFHIVDTYLEDTTNLPNRQDYHRTIYITEFILYAF